MLAVTEPSLDSLELAEKIGTLAESVGIERAWAILNKITSKATASKLTEELEGRGISSPIGVELSRHFQSATYAPPFPKGEQERIAVRIVDKGKHPGQS